MYDVFQRVRSENRILTEELKLRLLTNEQLQNKCRILRQDLEDYFNLARIKKAMHFAKPLDKRMVINFPKETFTLGQLAAANPAVCREDLIMHLAYRVSLRQVTFFPQHQKNQFSSPAFDLNPLVYQMAPDFHLEPA